MGGRGSEGNAAVQRMSPHCAVNTIPQVNTGACVTEEEQGNSKALREGVSSWWSWEEQTAPTGRTQEYTQGGGRDWPKAIKLTWVWPSGLQGEAECLAMKDLKHHWRVLHTCSVPTVNMSCIRECLCGSGIGRSSTPCSRILNGKTVWAHCTSEGATEQEREAPG